MAMTRVVYVRITDIIMANRIQDSPQGSTNTYDLKVLEEEINRIINEEWDHADHPQPIDIKIISAHDIVNGFFAMITFESRAAIGTG